MPISFQAALRAYAKKIGHFVLPAKGSEHYAAVKKIQMDTEMSDEHKIAPRKSKRMAPTPGGAAEESLTRRGEPNLPPAANATLLQDSQVSAEKMKGVIKKPLKKKEPVKKGGVKSDGLSKPLETQEFLVNSNTGPSAVISNQLQDQKDDLKKALKKGKKMGSDTQDAPNPNPSDKTVKNLPTDDKAGLKGGKVPFSMSALRLRIGA